MPYPLYLYIAGLAFLVSSTDPNKQLFNVKFVFESLNYAFNMSERYRLITFLGREILLFIKECPLKFISDNI